MKVTIENKKGVEKDREVFIDKKTIKGLMEEEYEGKTKKDVKKG